MTIRNRLSLRFTGLVSSIVLLAFVSIYGFCWYFITADFYRRLDRKANTIGDMLIRHRLDAQLIQRLSRLRKDQLPNQRIVVFDNRDSLTFSTANTLRPRISAAILADIRQNKQQDFRQDNFYLSATRFMTAAGQYVVIASAENSYGDEFMHQLFWALVGLFALIIGITAFAGWIFARDALDPVQRIDQILSQVFPDHRDERLPIKSEDDEIRRLSVTINGLLDRVAESFMLQRMFVANVSHELKNPLTQISSQLEVSLLNQRDPEAYRQTIRSVLDDVIDMATLTHELLQLSQINQSTTYGSASGGQRTTNMLTDAVRFDELVWDTRQEVNAINPTYQVQVKLDAFPDDPDQLTVQGNKRLLRTALKNLMENACKFSDDGQALVRVTIEQDFLVVQIENTGQSIPANDLPYIFEPFYRSRPTADVQGYGVGLTLVERIIRLHGGQVTVSSPTDNLTAFVIKLPK